MSSIPPFLRGQRGNLLLNLAPNPGMKVIVQTSLRLTVRFAQGSCDGSSCVRCLGGITQLWTLLCNTPGTSGT